MGIIYFHCGLSKWCTVVKYYSFMSFIWSFCIIIGSYPVIVMVLPTSIYASLWLYKLDLSIWVSNLIWPFFCVSHYSSFISTQFLVLNFDGWFGLLSNKFIMFGIPLLYCYINPIDHQWLSVFFLEIYMQIYIDYLIDLIFSGSKQTFFSLSFFFIIWKQCTPNKTQITFS